MDFYKRVKENDTKRKAAKEKGEKLPVSEGLSSRNILFIITTP